MTIFIDIHVGEYFQEKDIFLKKVLSFRSQKK